MFRLLPLPKLERTKGRLSHPMEVTIGRRKPSASIVGRRDIFVLNVQSLKTMMGMMMMMKNPMLPTSQRNLLLAGRAKKSPTNESILLKVTLQTMILMMTILSIMTSVISRG